MKILKPIFILAMTLLAFSCSNDDGPSTLMPETDPELRPYLSKYFIDGKLLNTFHYSQEMELDSIVQYDRDSGEPKSVKKYQSDASGKITSSVVTFPHYTGTTIFTYEGEKIKTISTTNTFNDGDRPDHSFSYNHSYPAENEIFVEYYSGGSLSFSYRYFMDANGDIQFAERRGGAMNRDITFLYDEGLSPRYLMSQNYKGYNSLVESKHTPLQEKIVNVDTGEEIIVNYENEFNAKNWLIKKTVSLQGEAEVEVLEYEYVIN